MSKAVLPRAMEGGGLKKAGDVVEYELCQHVHYYNIEYLFIITEDLKEALIRARMQRQRQRKRELNETPGKERKRKLITSNLMSVNMYIYYAEKK
ncbi:hypothetical protein CHS0354_019140 [Potamilus streckersoni]|uniref:Uncharacterized protein n=1 Tax=Potamilus streckersoni TaxID=2493646 RepID=A0AAE0SZV4_9BIVA|nr:hypothetical protein CHS0354_019140 [Potamilus streckersoni]